MSLLKDQCMRLHEELGATNKVCSNKCSKNSKQIELVLIKIYCQHFLIR